MTEPIKAIETRYKGYRFRSRLEARWAVFLDAVGLPWEYEKEGYDLGSEGWYLPDFWVPYEASCQPGWGFWIEIKPELLSEDESRKLAVLVRQTGHRAYAICGRPWQGEYSISVFQHHHGGTPNRVPLLVGKLVLDTRFSGDLYVWDGEKAPLFYDSPHFFPFPRPIDRFLEPSDFDSALNAARSARFEHGETPGASF